ncbi:hypothetical protein GCM10029976_031300 [Kribbella albertanoniae]|uniref:Cupin domain-containing protein n=1 Tax=Kribbella albertanoniae TaxID=1266829 RepID=A0A4R4QHF0_9ACTN|nr:cupin domain-containing protein [Kribbella albertanoniae]TDC35044.1 cupin domain-containing protein [Kribbella albertanoniae]
MSSALTAFVSASDVQPGLGFQAGDMSGADGLIVNAASGERIRIRPKDAGEDRDILVWDLWLAPGGRVPSGHVHPGQTETFHVQRGTLRFRLGVFGRVLVGPGESISVPAGRPHHFANVGDTEVYAVIETSPALEMEALLRTASTMADARPLPRPVNLLLFMDEFWAEVRAPYVPASLVRAFLSPVLRLVRRLGLDRRYRGLRDRTR